MMRRLVRAAIQNATITRGEGRTLRIDPIILRAANILPLEEVEIVNHQSGERFTTFVEAAGEGSGEIAVSMRAGDVVSVVSWGLLHDGQTLAHKANLVTLDAQNRVVAVAETACAPS
ncbi:MAG TPA: aspartate 1-decarboxylase [Thermoanaerobaculia bacterium]|nr:aspartate 1-decarboxylase [Thermoanaerobaculia bacterium]